MGTLQTKDVKVSFVIGEPLILKDSLIYLGMFNY
jgi:hypothetical protein